MTTKEAIVYWEGLRKTFSEQLEKEENHFGRMHLQTTIDVIDTTLEILQDQEQETNAPLTLDELRQMDGEPVWVCFIGGVIIREDGWFIVAETDKCEVQLKGKVLVYKSFEYYGKTWLAYRHKPEQKKGD